MQFFSCDLTMRQIHFFIIFIVCTLIMYILCILVPIDISPPSMDSMEATAISKAYLSNRYPTMKHDNKMRHFAFNISELNHRFRNTTERINAFERIRKGIGEVILIHTRKAAGSTIKYWLSRMLRYMNNHYTDTVGTDFRECWPRFHLIQHGTLTTQIMNKNTKQSVWVISLRHPLDRILSQYDFEWRWLYAYGTFYDELSFDEHSFDELNYWQHIENKNESEMRRIAKYKWSGISLQEWLHRVNVTELHKIRRSNATKEKRNPRVTNHMYLDNYYLWIFCCDTNLCNIYNDFIKTGKIWECLVNAMELLLNFDIIIITEWMNDMRPHLFVNKLFWGKVDWSVQNRYTQNRINRGSIKDHVANRGKASMVRSEIIDALRELNRWDLIFYNFAKHIAYHRMHFTENEFYSLSTDEMLHFKDDTIFEFDAVAPEFDRRILMKIDGGTINISRFMQHN